MDPRASIKTKLKAIFDFHKHRRFYDRLAHLPFWILWKIWTSRNKLTFQYKNNPWQQDLREAIHETEEWLTIDTRRCNTTSNVNNNQRDPPTPNSWQKPPHGWLKCNYDGSFIDRDRRPTAAWIVRDDQGQFKEAGQVTGPPVSSALEAECISLSYAIKQCWLSGFPKVIFEGDNQVLVNMLNGNNTRFDIFNWIQDIKGWTSRFESFAFKWIPRSANLLADKLAKV
ncbi:PREDICTED: uncharacterized protein LOC104738397 [Camelina sativa]|uniref:Uncharacterized protein LOC104738397 n=1 Tax=Camelina sativa TaxID=90675 RepID=A0ABM0VIU7_CAMSA|nr:PREDICTED: uncharacterized protein LOC104738397 [Camelina sativa]